MSTSPVVSVVLPTHGRRDSLLRVLRALALQASPNGAFEVVVICDGDVDGSAAACRRLAPELPYRLCVLEQPNGGPAAARNRGVAAARADLIVFLDDDVVPDAQLLDTHLRAHSQDTQLVSIGPLLPPPDHRMSAWAAYEARVLLRQYDDMGAGRWQATHRQFYTGNAAVRRKHIIDAGGFDDTFLRAEDVELAQRLHDNGLRFSFLPKARGLHYVTRSLSSWLRIPAAYGAADIAMARAGRTEILSCVADEYPRRSLAVRALTRCCVGRPFPMHLVGSLLRAAIQAADRVRLRRLGTVSCSLLFNLRYYNAIANGLGGRDAFLRLVGRGTAKAVPINVHEAEQRPIG